MPIRIRPNHPTIKDLNDLYGPERIDRTAKAFKELGKSFELGDLAKLVPGMSERVRATPGEVPFARGNCIQPEQQRTRAERASRSRSSLPTNANGEGIGNSLLPGGQTRSL